MATKKRSKPVRRPRSATRRFPDEDALRRDLDAVIRRWPPISDLERAAFTSQFDDDRCETAGRATDSLAVAREAIAWIAIVDPILRANPLAARRYPGARLVFLVECVRELLRMRTLQRAPDVGATSRAVAVHDARLVREDLLATLETIAAERVIEREAVAVARRSAESEDDLARSLYALADLAEAWMTGVDLLLRALTASFGVTQADVDRARSIADKISSAVTFARLGAAAVAEDAPEVDRIEGRVLMELRLLRALFARARAVDPSIPPLEPTAATRAVVGR